MRLPKDEYRIEADQNKEQHSDDDDMGTIRFHSAVCLKGSGGANKEGFQAPDLNCLPKERTVHVRTKDSKISEAKRTMT